MLKNWKIRTLVMILVAGGAGIVASSWPREAEALQCCSKCETIYTSCRAKCGSSQTCLRQCDLNYASCGAHCSTSC